MGISRRVLVRSHMGQSTGSVRQMWPSEVRTLWADGTASDNEGRLSPHHLPWKCPQSVSGIARILTRLRRKGAREGLARAPSSPGSQQVPAPAVQSPEVPQAGHMFPLGSRQWLGSSPRLCNDVWSRWQGWVFPAQLTEPHLPGNSSQFQEIPSSCSHPQPCCTGAVGR